MSNRTIERADEIVAVTPPSSRAPIWPLAVILFATLLTLAWSGFLIWMIVVMFMALWGTVS